MPKVCPCACVASRPTAQCAIYLGTLLHPRLWAPGTALTSASPAFHVEPLVPPPAVAPVAP
eukprot:13053199-Alexandrium_andersonii.AAC.1